MIGNNDEKNKRKEKIEMPEEKKNMPTVDSQYQRLINARNYHYDNFNKWLMTFYVIIGALLIPFYSVEKEFQVIVTIIGYIVSLAAWLSGKGYFFWENKWIEKIRDFEKNILKEEKDMLVYSYLVNPTKHDNPYHPFKGANISTTKVAIFMTALLTFAWGYLVMVLLLTDDTANKGLIALATSIGASYIFMVSGAKLLPSIEKKDKVTTSTNTKTKK